MSNRKEVVIREIEEKDCEEIAQLEKQCFSMPWNLDMIKQALWQQNNFFLVAEYGDKIVGYIGMVNSGIEGDILNLAVSVEMRRQGIATLLMETLLQFAQSKGMEQLFLEVRESNMEAIQLYQKQHWKKIYVRKNYYQSPLENGVIMTVDLTTWK